MRPPKGARVRWVVSSRKVIMGPMYIPFLLRSVHALHCELQRIKDRVWLKINLFQCWHKVSLGLWFYSEHVQLAGDSDLLFCRLKASIKCHFFMTSCLI